MLPLFKNHALKLINFIMKMMAMISVERLFASTAIHKVSECANSFKSEFSQQRYLDSKGVKENWLRLWKINYFI